MSSSSSEKISEKDPSPSASCVDNTMPPPISAPPNQQSDILRLRQNELKKFATFLASGSSDPRVADKVTALRATLPDSLNRQDVFLTLPSFDLHVLDESTALPKVGESQNKKDGPALEYSGGDLLRPSMDASVLLVATEQKASMERKMVEATDTLASWTASTVQYAPHALCSNLSELFSKLLSSRVRAWTLLLLRHSLSTGDSESRSRLLSILSSVVKVEAAETVFKVLDLPKASENEVQEADAILPLLFEFHVTVNIQNKTEKVILRAPGTISGHFLKDTVTKGLGKVDVFLDTSIVQKNMVEHARIVVFKAVATATKTTIPDGMTESNSPPGPEAPTDGPERVESNIVSTNLSGLRSSLVISNADPQEAPKLQKAMTSALRLNNVLMGRTESTKPNLGQRRNLSVRWDGPNHKPGLPQTLTPSAKKQRMIENAAKLKSYKSFGRPHAGDLGSGPRNATFGDYGRHGVWGRDGRMVHHPMPMTSMAAQELGPVYEAPDKNATFDLSRLKKPGTATAGSVSGVVPRLPRTATVLENWLLKKSTSGNKV